MPAARPLGVVAVTGATGFVGSGLLGAFAHAGFPTVGFARHCARGEDRADASAPACRPYVLEEGLTPAALGGIDVLVHCAFIPHRRGMRDSSERNVRGTLALYEAARTAGVRFVFLSSLSAVPGARSEYGMHKLELEHALRDTDALVLRPGLVVGDGGLIRGVYDAAQRGLVPLIDGGRQLVQVIGMRDLADAIAVGVAARLRGAHVVAAERALTLGELARTLCRRFELTPRFVSVPWALAWPIAVAGDRLGARLPLTPENLLGMRIARAHEPSRAYAALGWRARDWDALLAELELGPRA
ncbi:MAG TPA: NAD(P)-dependent oxidoreductase [Xanthomonadales bacterium]|nr:NAD(P)-dependent oxidoreductase [Xanthomonadales bacterium]